MHPYLSKFFWILLYPLAVLWSGMTSIRRFVFGTRGYRSKLPTLCIGNLHSGGSSKTPIVIEIAKHLANREPVIVSRGYLRTFKAASASVDLAVVDGARVFGDEPWLIANETNLPVWVGKNRGLVVSEIEKKNVGGIIILDDGFQNLSLRKNVSVICINTDKKLPEANTLPLGELRESLQALKSASAVLLVRGHDDLSFLVWRGYLESEWEELPTFEVTPDYTTDAPLKTGKWIAFSGIAEPERFRHTLHDLNCDHELVIFADHHCYTSKDVHRLMAEKSKHEAVGFVTTQKDYYKAVEVFKKVNEKVYFIKMEVNIEERFWEFINDQMKIQ